MNDNEEAFKNFPREFQTEILSCLLQSKRFLRESLGLLKPEYFEHRLHTLAAQSIYDIYLKTKHMPNRMAMLHSLTESFGKAVRVRDKEQHSKLILKPINRLLDTLFAPVSGSSEYVKQSALKFCRVQELKKGILETYEELEKEGDPEKAKEMISRKIRSLDTTEHGGLDFQLVYEDLPRDLDQDKSRCAKTGFPSLDRWMEGGMDPGTETVFMAPPKYGKSTILANVGVVNLIRRVNVFHFTLEISEKKTIWKYARRVTRMSTKEIKRNPGMYLERAKKFWNVAKGKLIVKGYPTKSATVETLKSYIYARMNRTDIKPGMIIVDYGDLLRSSTIKERNSDTERLIQGGVYEDLRAMAQEFDCPVVTASQCNRAAAAKPIIHMEDIAESYQKCMVADHIIAICGTEEERREKRLRLFFAGSREAETGKLLRIMFDWDLQRMKQVKKEDPPEEQGEKKEKKDE